MKLIVLNPDSDATLRETLETLEDGRIVIKNTIVTLPTLFHFIASRGSIKDASLELGIEADRIKRILEGLSLAFEALSPLNTDHSENRINAVATAWSHSIGLPFKPYDRKGRATAVQFLAMLEAAGILENPRQTFKKRFTRALAAIHKFRARIVGAKI